MSSKKKSTLKKEARKPDELKKQNIEKGQEKKEKQSTITSQLKNQDVYSKAVGQSEHNTLLGFQGEEEYVYRDDRRGGRGRGRGGQP